MDEVVLTTTCALRAGTIGSPNGPSLGFVDVLDISGLTFTKHPGWSAAERVKIANALSQVDLFGSASIPPKLEAPRFIVRYRYRCAEAGCAGHVGQILDWELTELQRRLGTDSDEDAQRKITEKYFEMMAASKRLTRFYLGNFERPTKRDKFSVLGVYYPERGLASTQSPLVDERVKAIVYGAQHLVAVAFGLARLKTEDRNLTRRSQFSEFVKPPYSRV